MNNSDSNENRDNNGGEAGYQSSSGKGGSRVKFRLSDWTDLESFDKVQDHDDPNKFEAWLRGLESRASIYKYDDDETRRILLLKLDPATRVLIPDDASLEEAKTLLLEVFGHPRRDPTTALQELLNIRQENGESITEYYIRHKQA